MTAFQLVCLLNLVGDDFELGLSSATATTDFRIPILSPSTALKTLFLRPVCEKVFRMPLSLLYSVCFGMVKEFTK